MTLAREDANRILRFCVAGHAWGSASRQDDVCSVTIIPSKPAQGATGVFEGATFEEALRAAAAGGYLKSSALEKQIAFTARSLPDRAGADVRSTEASDSIALVAEGQLFPTITTAISALIHETQLERGVSSLYAASAGRLFQTELRRQWRATDQLLADLISFRTSNPPGLPRGVALRLSRIEEDLARLVEGRNEVGALQVTPSEIVDRYTAVNMELLGIIDELAMRAVSRARAVALAWLALLHAKEKTGVERAQLAGVFVSDCFVGDQQNVLAALISARHSYLHLFAIAAPKGPREILQRSLESADERALTEMEGIALGRRDGGFGVDPSLWFSTISRKIDSLAEIESAVRVSLSDGV